MPKPNFGFDFIMIMSKRTFCWESNYGKTSSIEEGYSIKRAKATWGWKWGGKRTYVDLFFDINQISDREEGSKRKIILIDNILILFKSRSLWIFLHVSGFMNQYKTTMSWIQHFFK